jgi:hypothetical protein
MAGRLILFEDYGDGCAEVYRGKRGNRGVFWVRSEIESATASASASGSSASTSSSSVWDVKVGVGVVD